MSQITTTTFDKIMTLTIMIMINTLLCDRYRECVPFSASMDVAEGEAFHRIVEEEAQYPGSP